MTDNPLHSSKSDEWFTPGYVVEAARKALGTINLDPASCFEANCTVQAEIYYTLELGTDGLVMPWEGKVFLNPPGALWKSFWVKLCSEYNEGRTVEAVFVGYSLEQLQTAQNSDAGGILSNCTAICIPNRRIRFIPKGGGPSLSPTHGNFIAYLGSNPMGFCKAFKDIGETEVLK